jgi:hypothetical protein
MTCPGGGTGRRAGLKILSGLYFGAGSIPAPGTLQLLIKNYELIIGFYNNIFYFNH